VKDCDARRSAVMVIDEIAASIRPELGPANSAWKP